MGGLPSPPNELALDLVSSLSLNAVGRCDDQPHPVGAGGQRGCVFGGDFFGTKGIELCGLGGHGAALLGFKIPFDGCGSVRFDRTFDLAGSDGSNTAANVDGGWVYLYCDLGDGCFGCFNDRYDGQIAPRVGDTRGNPAIPASIKWVNNIPPVGIRTFAGDLGGLPNGQPADDSPACPRTKTAINRNVLWKCNRDCGRGC